MPRGAPTGPPQVTAMATSVTAMARAKPTNSRWLAAARSPRFQASVWPNGTTRSSGTASGTKVRLKKGGPTEIFSPVSDSSARG